MSLQDGTVEHFTSEHSLLIQSSCLSSLFPFSINFKSSAFAQGRKNSRRKQHRGDSELRCSKSPQEKGGSTAVLINADMIPYFNDNKGMILPRNPHDELSEVLEKAEAAPLGKKKQKRREDRQTDNPKTRTGNGQSIGGVSVQHGRDISGGYR